MGRPFRMTWTRQRALAAAAFTLGAIALAGRPVPGHTVRVDAQELATIVSREVDHVTPAELADWIIRGATDYRLVDVRSPAEYAAYHIPTAENVPIAALLDYGLARNEKIVFCSEGGIHSAQAWMLLRAERYQGVYILQGGLEGWKEDVLHPVAPVGATPRETAAFERAAQVARFFGGEPQVAAGGSSMLVPVPVPDPGSTVQVPPPKPPTGGAPAVAPHKKKEGC